MSELETLNQSALELQSIGYRPIRLDLTCGCQYAPFNQSKIKSCVTHDQSKEFSNETSNPSPSRRLKSRRAR
jgi:hypothetical protein